jgi:hypothetical protein
MTRIYYNDLFIDDQNKSIEIYDKCNYIDVNDNEVDDFIEEKIDWGEWHCWVIPSKITNYTIIRSKI